MTELPVASNTDWVITEEPPPDNPVDAHSDSDEEEVTDDES